MSLKKRLLIFAFALVSFQGHATHLLGGEIVWKCKPNGKYQFTLVLYRECAGISLPTTAQSLATNAGVSISCAFISTTDVVPSCYTGTTSCSGAVSGTGKMRKYVYRSGDITLTGTPPAGGWYFTWSSCCRSGSISNVVSPGGASYLLRAVMYPYTPPGATAALSVGTTANPSCYDSSPNFLEDPQVISCTGVDVIYNNLGYDPDLDSLHYNWSYPWDASSYSANPASNSVNFASGYTYNSPLPSGSSSTPATIDGETGEVTFNSGVAGSWATCVVIEEWRCGQKIGEIYRDIPIVTLGCTPPAGLCAAGYVDAAPDMSLTPDNSLMNATVLTPVINTAGDTIYYYTEAFPGDTIRFKITASDAYPNPNCSPQDIQFTASGGNLSSAANYGNANACLFNPPCATLTSLNPGGVFTYPGTNDAQFNWVADTAHLQYGQQYCSTSESKYEFYFRMQDDQCPINRFSQKKVVVKILGSNLASPELPQLKCGAYLSNGQLELGWTPNQDTGLSWQHYTIGSEDSNGVLLSTVLLSNWSDSVYTVVNATPSQGHKYFIQTKGGLGGTSTKRYFPLNRIFNYTSSSCAPITINGITYDSTGTYIQQYTSAKGCDSTYSIAVIINASNFLQNPENDTVGPGQTARFSVDAATGVSYQWQANTGNGFINIADGGQYQGTQDHTIRVFSAQPMNHLTEYRCIKAGGICSDTSEVATLYLSTIGILEQESNINIFPNPANEYITIESSNAISSIMIKDELGRILFQSKLRNKGCTINVKKWPTGAYILIIEQGNSIIQKKIVLIK
jgi:hypothetical protein